MKLSRSLLAACAVAVTGGVVWLVLTLRPSSSEPMSDVRVSTAATQKVSRTASSETKVDPEIAKLATRADVDVYLGRLVEAARARGSIERVDYDNGRHAIHQLRGQLSEAEVQARARRFGEELSLTEQVLAYKPITDELDALATKLQSTTDREARIAIASKYRQSVQNLPAPARRGAMARLATLIGDQQM